MQNERPNLTLLAACGWNLMDAALEKPLFGRQFVRYSKMLTLSGYMYESGAILGRALHTNIDSLETVLGAPENPGELIRVLQQGAKDTLEQYQEKPTSFGLLVAETYLREYGLSLTSPDVKRMKQLLETKVEPRVADGNVQDSMAGGIGFGSLYPELTEEIYKATYQQHDAAAWSQARMHGLEVPERNDAISLEEQEHNLLTFTAEYVSEFFPSQVLPLGLNTYLVTG